MFYVRPFRRVVNAICFASTFFTTCTYAQSDQIFISPLGNGDMSGENVENSAPISVLNDRLKAQSNDFELVIEPGVYDIEDEIAISNNRGSYGTFYRLFSSKSPWNIRPVKPILGTYSIPEDDYKPSITRGRFSLSVFKADKGDPPVTIFPLIGKSIINDPDSGQGQLSISLPHWPEGVFGAEGSDGHADVVDVENGIIHSFWKLRFEEGVWRTQHWAWSKLDGLGFADPKRYYQGSRAVGVVASGGLIRKHEVNDGKELYEHVLAMSLSKKALSKSYVFPATAADGSASINEGEIPQGSLLMLPSDFDLNLLNKQEVKKVARTLMTYGGRVVDRNGGTPFVIYVETGADWVGHGVTGWDTRLAADLELLRKSLRVVESQDEWIDINDRPVELIEDALNTPLLSMRGGWVLEEGSVLGQFSSLSQTINWSATGANPSIQRNNTYTGYERVNWAPIVYDGNYTAWAESTNGATCRLEFINQVNFKTDLVVNLIDNEKVDFVWPRKTRMQIVAVSGTNVDNSSLACELIRRE